MDMFVGWKITINTSVIGMESDKAPKRSSPRGIWNGDVTELRRE
jgi:hypothetical protein